MQNGLTNFADERVAAVVDVLAGVVDVTGTSTLDQKVSYGFRCGDGASEYTGGDTEEGKGGSDELGEEHGGGVKLAGS